jgi:hypothetical protein
MEDGAFTFGDEGGGGVVVGPPGNVGSLIVALGFGGRLMRTVSFFGCTFDGSGGFGGTGPLGIFGWSAINLLICYLPN